MSEPIADAAAEEERETDGGDDDDDDDGGGGDDDDHDDDGDDEDDEDKETTAQKKEEELLSSRRKAKRIKPNSTLPHRVRALHTNVMWYIYLPLSNTASTRSMMCCSYSEQDVSTPSVHHLSSFTCHPQSPRPEGGGSRSEQTHLSPRLCYNC